MGEADSAGPEPLEPFDQLSELIREEWPEVGAEELAETQGDFQRVVALIAAETEHTKALVRRKLAELRRIAADAPPTRSEVERLRETVERLRKKSDEIAAYVRGQMLADVKEHPLVALLMAMGLGILLGFILRGGGRGRR